MTLLGVAHSVLAIRRVRTSHRGRIGIVRLPVESAAALVGVAIGHAPEHTPTIVVPAGS